MADRLQLVAYRLKGHPGAPQGGNAVLRNDSNAQNSSTAGGQGSSTFQAESLAAIQETTESEAMDIDDEDVSMEEQLDQASAQVIPSWQATVLQRNHDHWMGTVLRPQTPSGSQD